jgi:BirA family biotin operon repressor/biotin-[acetyl-CoA-carboxylase] ligase
VKLSRIDSGEPPAGELHPARLLGVFRTSRLGRPAILFEEVVSTNTVAMEAAIKGVPEGTIILAEKQTGGRGRKGREWISTSGKSLVFSIILRPAYKNYEGLTSLFALGTALTLEEICSETGIRWPNDVYLGGGKICGILAESRGGVIVMGVGLNINEGVGDFKGGIEDKAISLRMVTGSRQDRGLILGRILEQTERLYSRWETVGLTELRHDIQERLMYMGEEVVLESGSQRFVGRLLGINSDGYLRLGVRGEERLFTSGDLTLRREGE